ncbi:MAG: UvrD-helicase domain-containing protein [Planctomycetes bacterium]|jgi:DNA helicase-2/ATP-dependent DNA helicase PcrA|nr:UvrD-helicase domain-containing protein [Planctomycetota bacterium]MBT4559306.1 UvrD-helicase domain-containing protein [Planctomycetota bacterium]MBT5101609.1 UvrD-helicase domain-containing protein [Planctomycetota bacterium]MBT5121050.1 UvrD-helicase domain-containing protein [Planctomycetota bacterium]MBT7012715.1 UvrD-helicase domain-containing protein [Planctomycetota bacterium]
MRKLLSSLNPEQRHAVMHTQGPVLVLAGAGSGKTRVITVRTAYLMSGGVPAENILCMTFTKKAAREMRERLKGMVGKDRADGLTVCTFHALCVQMLREAGEKIGLPKRFTICDATDQITVVKKVLRQLHIAETSVRPWDAKSAISLWKNCLVSPEQALDAACDDREILMAHAFEKYEERLLHSRLLDFDDLLLRGLQLLKEDKASRELFQNRWQYLMVDEYQDTNAPQYAIIQHLTGKKRNLCVVGDDDQSIYGWRGADVSKILRFPDDFPGAEIVRLERNYRSTAPILEAANRVIANNTTRHDKTLIPVIEGGEKPRIMQCDDETHEARLICDEIRLRVEGGDASFGQHAILFRTQTQPRAFEAELRSRGIPYVLVGGMSFFDRKEVKDVLCYLRLLANADDESALVRILDAPPRGVGKATMAKAVDWAIKHGISANAAFQHSEEAGIAKGPARAYSELQSSLEVLRLQLEEGRALTDVMRDMISAVDYRAEVERSYPDEQEQMMRWNAVMEMLNFSQNYERSCKRKKKKPTLHGFLEAIVLSATEDTSAEDASKRGSVTLMTLHAAKGLEFPRVYLVGLEEGLLPHRRSALEDSIPEERRLAYVGITRAERHLTLSFATTRAKMGKAKTSHPSRFLFEMTGKDPYDGWVPIEQSLGFTGQSS